MIGSHYVANSMENLQSAGFETPESDDDQTVKFLEVPEEHKNLKGAYRETHASDSVKKR